LENAGECGKVRNNGKFAEQLIIY